MTIISQIVPIFEELVPVQVLMYLSINPNEKERVPQEVISYLLANH